MIDVCGEYWPRVFESYSLIGWIGATFSSTASVVALWPGRIAAGRTIDEIVQTIDVTPTLLELAGLPIPRPVQGQSLASFLRPEAAPRSPM